MSFGLFKDKRDRWMGVGFFQLGQGSLLNEFDGWCAEHGFELVRADDIDRMGWDRYAYLPREEDAVLFRMRWDAQIVPQSVHEIFQGFLDQHNS